MMAETTLPPVCSEPIAAYIIHIRSLNYNFTDFGILSVTDPHSTGATGRLWEAKPPQCVTQASPDSEAYATKI